MNFAEWVVGMVQSLPAAIGVLTAMITPALLISASGTFILSTSQRLGRVVDRTRKLAETIEEVVRGETVVSLKEERLQWLFSQIDRQMRRARLLQISLSVFYVSAVIFVASSVAIGLAALFARFAWVPVVLGLGGASCLLVGSTVLILEARIAITSLDAETAFLAKLVRVQQESALTREG
ncbi:MAG: DUF2721 domain-containing protein [Bryobacteraceae bacterium]|nr:DUF2721 domain-containing protein [Bryobacteraceae bacterium]